MAQSGPWGHNKGFRQVARLELPGAGQVVVEGHYAYVAHMSPPAGTTIVDVSDVKNPKVVTQLELPPNLHSHKVRVHGDVMLVNHEKYRGYRGEEKPQGGLKVYDISNRTRPREIAFMAAGEWGYHRFTFDGRYCYGSPAPDGYVGNIMEILDLHNPAKPEIVSHWWVPGQWVAGGETPLSDGRRVRCHHPMRLGDRLIAPGGTTAGTSSTLATSASHNPLSTWIGVRRIPARRIPPCRFRGKSAADAFWS